MKNFVRCPSCDRKLLVRIEREGHRMRCPRCLTRFVLGSRLMADVAGRAQYLAFELFSDEEEDDEIEVLDEEEDAAPPPPPPTPAGVSWLGPAQDHPIPAEPPRPRRRRSNWRESFDDPYGEQDYYEYAATHANSYVYDPYLHRPGWRMVNWGLMLLAMCLVANMAAGVLIFVAMAIIGIDRDTLESGLGLIGLGFLFQLGACILQLAGFGMCLNVPRYNMTRGWALLAMGCAVAAGVPGVLLVFGFDNKVVALAVGGSGVVLGLGAWGVFLVYLDNIAEMFAERGISDAINSVMKLGGTLLMCVLIGIIAQCVVLDRVAGRNIPNSDPTLIVIYICGGVFGWFTGILGLCVCMKYIFVLLNVRALIEWCTE
ncbi:MAG: hypothetical protein ACJ8F7_09325 [Gemmataceae bacterium]